MGHDTVLVLLVAVSSIISILIRRKNHNRFRSADSSGSQFSCRTKKKNQFCFDNGRLTIGNVDVHARQKKKK